MSNEYVDKNQIANSLNIFYDILNNIKSNLFKIILIIKFKMTRKMTIP